MSYELGRMIGKGSDGEVYELIDRESIQKKVIKYIQPKITGINNYLEPYILLHLEHNNLMKAENIELESNGLMKIIQEKADYDLHNKLRNYLILDTDKLKYMRQLTEAVYYLQRHNIIHGDIKPENILLLNNNIKLCDFSLSKLIKEEPAVSNKNYTLVYRPPEVNRGQLYLKSDIWALGCTLYKIYTGCNYFTLSKEKKLFHIKRLHKKNQLFDLLIANMIKEDIDKRFDIEQVLPFFNIASIKETYKLVPLNNYIDKNINSYFMQKCYSICNNKAMTKKYSEQEYLIANNLNFKVFNKLIKFTC